MRIFARKGRDPDPDPLVDPFRDGSARLIERDRSAGHLFSTVMTFRSLLSPWRPQWWVWYLIVWSDGTREEPEEDYPPWTTVREAAQGHVEIDGEHRSGRFRLEWLPLEESIDVRRRLDITDDSF